MAERIFGTDGIRGPVGVGAMSPEAILKLGAALGMVLGRGAYVVLAKDTRASCYVYEALLQAGLLSMGCNVYLLGPMPTPGIAYLTRTLQAAAGIVISASHNQHADNGIKFFCPDGMKLPDAMEREIEKNLELPKISMVESSLLGRAMRVDDAQGRYIEFCKSTFPRGLNLKGLKIVVDCANGAAYNVAPKVFQELGAEVVAIGNKPDGLNINLNCGATYPQAVAAKVKEVKADLGIALDGDGDRVIMVDHTGAAIDGDEILFMITCWYMHNEKNIAGVAGTLMSNYGLEAAFKEMNVPFCRTSVGDRYVLEALKQRNWILGGESSGHIICLDAHSTGDGIIAALKVLALLVTFGQTLFERKQLMQKHPQVLINVPISGENVDVNSTNVRELIIAAEDRLQQQGRVLVRTSGTESILRVMVEHHDAKLAQEIAQDLAQTLSTQMQQNSEGVRARMFSSR